MYSIITSLVLASLLIPSGFNFLVEKSTDYSFPQESQEVAGPTRIINNSLGIETTADTVLIVDEESGKILYAKNQYNQLPIASITKLMTALVFLENNPGWEEKVTIIEEDKREGGIIYLLPGEEVTVKDLFYLTLVASANEATIALTRSTGIDNFVSQMNAKAFTLGMMATNFVDVAGLEPANISTPADLIKLGQAVFAQPDILVALTLEKYNFTVLNNQRSGKATNTNKLLDSFLNYNGYQIIGAKTGYLDEADHCLLMKVKKIDGPTLFLILLGADSKADRWQEVKGLIDWIFRNYQWPN